MQDKFSQLNQAKRLALGCLIIAASVFITTTFLPKVWPELSDAWWLGLIKMASEAALVGGLADWFAVTALFKPIPAKYPIPHTNIVASNKTAIAQNLSLFVKDKFFQPDAIAGLITKSDLLSEQVQWQLFAGRYRDEDVRI